MLVPSSNDPLVRLAWSTIRTLCPVNDVGKSDEAGPTEEVKEKRMVECVTFENFAMLLNLINNVYIKNKIQAKSAHEVIDEEEEGSEECQRPFGYVDS